MNLIGERGQAFSTFKLLIAAIVAVVILMILLSILGYINFSPRNQPIVSAADALKSAYQTPSQLVTSQKVTFTKSNNTLSRLTVVERANIGISQDQVCLSLGDFAGLAGQGGFDGGVDGNPDNANRIMYTGGGSRDAKLSVLCYTGENLKEIVGTGDKAIYTQIKDEWVDNCACAEEGSDLAKQTCCLIALRVATR